MNSLYCWKKHTQFTVHSSHLQTYSKNIRYVTKWHTIAVFLQLDIKRFLIWKQQVKHKGKES